MPNFMSDEDRSLNSGDSRSCDYCGAVYSVDEWHVCAERMAEEQRQSDEFVRQQREGGRGRFRLELEFECYANEQHLRTAIDEMISEIFTPGMGADDIEFHFGMMEIVPLKAKLDRTA